MEVLVTKIGCVCVTEREHEAMQGEMNFHDVLGAMLCVAAVWMFLKMYQVQESCAGNSR